VWLAGFVKRHHTLSLRQPQLTSLAGGSGSNEVVVHTSFGVLGNNVGENKITDSRIFNMEET
jgi:hypothetical protein